MEKQDLALWIVNDPEAGLRTAMQRHAPAVKGILTRILPGRPQDVEECMSDVFVALWQSAEGLREDSDLKLWLGVVARNRALKHLRALRLELPLEDAFLPGPEPTRFWERQEETQLVRQALLRLSPTDRDIFLRHYYWRQTVARIAEELGMNPSTVKSRLKRGREKLRNTLKKEDA